jgi:hypothetical protein
LDFWFENKPSGNPARDEFVGRPMTKIWSEVKCPTAKNPSAERRLIFVRKMMTLCLTVDAETRKKSLKKVVPYF